MSASLTPTAVLLAAAEASRQLAAAGATVTGVSLTAASFRLEGTAAGKRLVVEAVFTARGSAVEAIVTRQAGRSARSRRATAADHTAAVLAALTA